MQTYNVNVTVHKRKLHTPTPVPTQPPVQNML